MTDRFTYGQLRQVLTDLGFREVRRSTSVGLEHRSSKSLFVFRPYEENDRMQPSEISMVSEQLDARGLISEDSFAAMLRKTSA